MEETLSIPGWLVWALIILAVSLVLLWLIFGKNLQGLGNIFSFIKIFG